MKVKITYQNLHNHQTNGTLSQLLDTNNYASLNAVAINLNYFQRQSRQVLL